MPGSSTPDGHLRHETSAARGSVLGGLVGLIFLAPTAECQPARALPPWPSDFRGTGIDETFLEDMKAPLQLLSAQP